MRRIAICSLLSAVTLAGSAAFATPPLFSPSTTALDPGFRSALLSDAAVSTDTDAFSPQQMPIDWASARTDREAQSGAAIGVRGPAEFDRVTLPLLLPDNDVIDFRGTEARLFARDNFYTASITGDGVIVEVFGTRQRLNEAPDPGSVRRLEEARDADGFVTTPGEGSWEVAFNRYGAAYSVTVECGDPASLRCADALYVRSVARSLLIAGGHPDSGK